jgi:hypothetical protein
LRLILKDHYSSRDNNVTNKFGAYVVILWGAILMPTGVFEDFEPGYLAFVGVKLVGYSIAGYALNRAYANLKRHS